MPRRSGERTERARRARALAAVPLLLLTVAAGCGQATPEETVYRFLGAVQARDFDTMRGCINPEAARKVEESEGDLAREWGELQRKYLVGPIDWRMEFELVQLSCTYLDPVSALVRVTGGRCRLYELEDDRWSAAGEIDFSSEDFPPLYAVARDGVWYLEALDLYIVYALENAARM